ncbi:MAG: heme-binding protein [Mycobacteriaceae bacterium]|nr:heme-binding protein [Mycobacteriaceae bacterium]
MTFTPAGLRRTVSGGIAATAVCTAYLWAASAPAAADPPNCTAGDLAGVASGVAAATSAYLFSHPDANAFFTSLKGQPRDQLSSQAQDYLNANPDVQNDIQQIRQPMVDFRNRCQ